MTALIWDLDDTLYNLMLPFKNACESTLGISLKDPEYAYKRFRFRGDEVFEASQRGEISLFDSRIYRFQKAMEDCGIQVSETQAALFQETYKTQQMQISLSEEMKALLEECKNRKVLMAVLTNGPLSHQLDKVHALGLLEWIPRENIFISGEIGYIKPDVQSFRTVEKALDLDPEESLMIGDNYSSDIKGAMEAGWKTLWFNRRKKERPADSPAPDHTVDTEEELSCLIKRIIR